MGLPGVLFGEENDRKMIAFRWLDNLYGYFWIAAFASFKFSCAIFANEEYRQFGQNPVIDRIFIIGCVCWSIDVILFIVLRRSSVFLDDKDRTVDAQESEETEADMSS